MRHLLLIAATVAVLLLGLAPAALADGPITTTGHGVLFSADGTVDVPAGQSIDAVVVANGSATIEGNVDTIVVLEGVATLSGATARHLVVIDGTANLGAGTVVSGDIATLRGDVVRAPDAVVMGRVTTLDGDLAALSLALVPVAIVLTVGFALAMLAAGLVLAAFGARQVRTAEGLISSRPGQVIIAGVAGAVGLPILAGLLIVTVIGAPLGLALLFVGMPLLALVGWLVAAIWVGDWLLSRSGGPRTEAHPYRAAVLGVVVLAIAGILPFVSGLATVFGLGAVVLAAYRTLQPEAPTPTADASAGWTAPAPAAG